MAYNIQLAIACTVVCALCIACIACMHYTFKRWCNVSGVTGTYIVTEICTDLLLAINLYWVFLLLAS